ncbi:MAG: helix-turn-helix transcriptional regulator [bacterium]|nr:helix-turn-helix transcriptional regulator [bacterium]
MVRFRLHIVMAEKGPGRPYKISEIARATGLQSNTVSGIYNNKARRIDLDTIDVLCRALQCEPGNLFEYREDELI